MKFPLRGENMKTEIVFLGHRPHYYLDNGEDAVIMWEMEL